MNKQTCVLGFTLTYSYRAVRDRTAVEWGGGEMGGEARPVSISILRQGLTSPPTQYID